MISFIKILLFLIFFSTVYPQQLYESRIVPFDGQDHDYFGASVAVSDSLLFVSSIRYSNHAENSVYIYSLENNNYDFLYKIYPSDTQPGTRGMLFGGELLYSDGQLFVGARNRLIDNIPVGAVYLFEYGNNKWVEKQIILPPQPYPYNGYFPSFISKSNDYLLIGSDHYDPEFGYMGKAFLYKFIDNKYELYQEFSPFDGKRYQLYGGSGAIKNNTILIGSPYDSTKSGIYSGSVYVYFREDSLWRFNRKYEPKLNSQLLSYGTSLTLTDDYVFIGTTGHPNYYKPGKVYIYNYSEPSLEFAQIIETGDNYFNDLFGIRLSAKGDSLLVGALFDTVKTDYPGSAYLFVNDSGEWKKRYKVYPSDEINTSGFGGAVILTDEKIFIGARLTKVNGISSGAVYVYSDKPLPVEDNSVDKPDDFFISQNYPNPFNPTTRIDLFIPREGEVNIKVYDITGGEVKTVLGKKKYPGHYTVDINLGGLPSGVYFYRIEYVYEEGNKMHRRFITKKAVLIK